MPRDSAASATLTAARPDLAAIKARQQATWSTGDYSVVGATVQIVAELLCQAVDLRPGESVLDVATGSGNTALAAARCFADVAAVDYVPSLLARGRDRAAAERLAVDFRDGDAEALPFADASFDVVLSTFGVMFAPDHQRAADELLRVCRPGGRIGLASWTPDGVLGETFRLIGKHLPPPAGLEPAVAWGSDGHLRKLFGSGARAIACRRQTFTFRYRSFAHWLDLFRTFYGPMHRAFAALDADRQAALTNDLQQLLTSRNRSGDATLLFPGDYLEVVVTRA